jgi:hypothetical protein
VNACVLAFVCACVRVCMCGACVRVRACIKSTEAKRNQTESRVIAKHTENAHRIFLRMYSEY